MSLTIICTGDIHMGRCASNIPPERDISRFSATAAWTHIVERAISEGADLVALTGDVVDRENRYYEAYGPLENGLRRLAEAGIHTYAVSGNHDFDVLPRLVDSVGTERFHLLGRGGKWEYADFRRNGQIVCRLQGWSFPREHFPDNPLRTYDLPAAEDVPTIGLLHTELDKADSRYAPTTANELQAKPVLLWLIGHVHKPDWRPCGSSAGILNPGSPLGLDPGETGQHGPWKIVIENSKVHAEQLAMSRVRYETVALEDLTELRTVNDLASHVPQHLRKRLSEISADTDGLEYVAFRLHLKGTCPLHRSLQAELEKLTAELELTDNGISARVEGFTVNTRPELDLQELARGSNAVSVLAHLILTLDNPAAKGETESLVRQLRTHLTAVHGASVYRGISTDNLPDENAMVVLLRREGYSLLDQLVSQKALATP